MINIKNIIYILIIIFAILGLVAFILQIKNNHKENYKIDKDIFCANKLSYLHNKIINNILFRFCKIDYIDQELKYIGTVPNNVILITGNGDYPVDDRIASMMPVNIVKWYAVNNLTNHPKIITIPLGLENSVPCVRKDHGVRWNRAIQNNKLLKKIFNRESDQQQNKQPDPTKLLYLNYSDWTFPEWRKYIKQEASKYSHITIADDRNYKEYIADMLEHEAIICPRGNGADTHRLWEAIMVGRIPIVFAEEPTEKLLYNSLYKYLPVIMLDKVSDLGNKRLLIEKIKEAKNKSNEMASFNFWDAKIKENAIDLPLIGYKVERKENYKKFDKPIKLFNLDLHISVIEDIIYNLQEIYKSKIVVEDWSISGHTHIMNKTKKDVKHITSESWRNIDKKMINDFVKEYYDHLDKFDGFIVTHTPVFCLLYMSFKKPIFIINSCRFTQPFCWNHNYDMYNYMIESMREYNRMGLLHVISNNKSDQHYFNNLVGINSIHIPSLCLYTKSKNIQPSKKIIYQHHPNHLLPKLNHIYNVEEHLGENFKWKDYYNCSAIIHIPYEMSTMSIFEQYSANIPLIFPSKRFLKYLIDTSKIQFQSINAYGGMLNTYPYRDINFWINNADFYDSDNMKYIIYFNSFDEIESIINTTDFSQVSKNMEYWNKIRQQQVNNSLKSIFDNSKLFPKKIISFSLWGDQGCYNWGALENALIAQKYLPDWKCRYYLGKNVISKMVNLLKTLPNVELVDMSNEAHSELSTGVSQGMMWRFIPAFNSMDTVIIRDTDSLLNPRDIAAINQWLDSDKDFHIIRDAGAGSHGSRIMGGMWGVRNGLLKPHKKLFDERTTDKKYGGDQKWLNEVIYPLIRNHAFINDKEHIFSDEIEYPGHHDIPETNYNNHIGAIICDQYDHIKNKFNFDPGEQQRMYFW